VRDLYYVASRNASALDRVCDVLEPLLSSNSNRPVAPLKDHHLLWFIPRPSFRSVWSTNALAILGMSGCGIGQSSELLLERGRIWSICCSGNSGVLTDEVLNILHDPLLEVGVPGAGDLLRESVWMDVDINAVAGGRGSASRPTDEGLKSPTLPLASKGVVALEEYSQKHGLGLGAWEGELISSIFQDMLRRDPTEVEVFDLAQSFSEHCRHWMFNGR
jgi:hypothetical protein